MSGVSAQRAHIDSLIVVAARFLATKVEADADGFLGGPFEVSRHLDITAFSHAE
jgi:hypothetical protein